MSKIIVLNENLENSSEISLPDEYKNINPHNLYLYVKAYLANDRANSAHTKTRAEVRGGGRKPWRQKGRGTARAGSIRTNIWVGGGISHGPRNSRNYFQKVNKKQQILALKRAVFEKACNNKFFAIKSVEIPSGKTKDAFKFINSLNVKNALVIADFNAYSDEIYENTERAYRNLPNAFIIDISEVDAYLIKAFSAVLIEESALEKLIKEG